MTLTFLLYKSVIKYYYLDQYDLANTYHYARHTVGKSYPQIKCTLKTRHYSYHKDAAPTRNQSKSTHWAIKLVNIKYVSY